MITSIAVVKLRASQLSSIKINNEKMVVLNRIKSFSSLANRPSLIQGRRWIDCAM